MKDNWLSEFYLYLYCTARSTSLCVISHRNIIFFFSKSINASMHSIVLNLNGFLHRFFLNQKGEEKKKEKKKPKEKIKSNFVQHPLNIILSLRYLVHSYFFFLFFFVNMRVNLNIHLIKTVNNIICSVIRDDIYLFIYFFIHFVRTSAHYYCWFFFYKVFFFGWYWIVSTDGISHMQFFAVCTKNKQNEQHTIALYISIPFLPLSLFLFFFFFCLSLFWFFQYFFFFLRRFHRLFMFSMHVTEIVKKHEKWFRFVSPVFEQ